MNKFLLIFITLFITSSCSYKPILTNKKNDFTLENINSDSDSKINVVIKKKLT